MNYWRMLLMTGIVAAGAAQASPVGEAPTMSREVEYVKKSVEYAKICEQTYEWGWKAVSAAAPAQKGAWAVVLDIDETVIDNSQFQKELGNNPLFWDPWKAWIKRRESAAVPGAKKFLDRVRSLKNGHIVFITDRSQEQELDTVENMRHNGLYQDGDILLTKKDKTDTKLVRRECIQKGKSGGDVRCQKFKPMEIVAQFGDSLRDFEEKYGEEARKIRANDDPNWGSKYFVLPNPMYGQWMKDYD